MPCSIKRSLRERLDASKTFVLVVGDKTRDLTKGGCRYCVSYSPYGACHRSGSVDHRSFIEYECEYAAGHGLKIVVLYNSCVVNRDKCPQPLRYIGTHLAAICRDPYGSHQWDYGKISQAIRGY